MDEATPASGHPRDDGDATCRLPRKRGPASPASASWSTPTPEQPAPAKLLTSYADDILREARRLGRAARHGFLGSGQAALLRSKQPP